MANVTDYLPTPDEISPEAIIAARNRAVLFMKDWWPELDTRVNSVFGDLQMTPFAVMVAALEIAMARMKSDLDPANIAQGIVFDPGFVTAYLKNFGVSPRTAVASSGTLKLVFSVNKNYVIDATTAFLFGASFVQINSDEGNPITIYAANSIGAKRQLVKIGLNEYAVYLPATGAAGITIQDGAIAASSLTNAELISITAAGDFDSGLAVESLAELAAKAQKTFPSANLSSRGGAISFVLSTWPQLIGASVVMTGDDEMIRSGQNPMGIAEGAVDVYIRSLTSYAFTQASVALTYDVAQGGWVGQLPTNVTPAFYALKDGVFQVNNFINSRGVNKVFSRSTHPKIDSLGIAFSKYETLGILVKDTNPIDFQSGFVGEVKSTTGLQSAALTIAGEYYGSTFHPHSSRSISMRLDYAVTIDGVPGVSANVKDNLSGATATVRFVADAAVNAASASIVKSDFGYQTMFNGLDLKLISLTGDFNLTSLLGSGFEVAFQGRTANFIMNYLYEPILVPADNILNSPDNRPIQTSIIAKSFIPCHVQQFIVNFRAKFGISVDTASAQQAIFQYVNSIIYPDVYDESRISDIMRNYGASGVSSINKIGVIYPSLANVFVDQEGNQMTVPRYVTKTLEAPRNDAGIGARNISFILPLETIHFHGSII